MLTQEQVSYGIASAVIAGSIILSSLLIKFNKNLGVRRLEMRKLGP